MRILYRVCYYSLYTCMCVYKILYCYPLCRVELYLHIFKYQYNIITYSFKYHNLYNFCFVHVIEYYVIRINTYIMVMGIEKIY